MIALIRGGRLREATKLGRTKTALEAMRPSGEPVRRSQKSETGKPLPWQP
jgi:hypothetical protein